MYNKSIAGFGLITVIFMLVLFGSAGAYLVSMTSMTAQNSENVLIKAQLRVLAQSGAQTVLYNIKNNIAITTGSKVSLTSIIPNNPNSNYNLHYYVNTSTATSNSAPYFLDTYINSASTYTCSSEESTTSTRIVSQGKAYSHCRDFHSGWFSVSSCSTGQKIGDSQSSMDRNNGCYYECYSTQGYPWWCCGPWYNLCGTICYTQYDDYYEVCQVGPVSPKSTTCNYQANATLYYCHLFPNNWWCDWYWVLDWDDWSPTFERPCMSLEYVNVEETTTSIGTATATLTRNIYPIYVTASYGTKGTANYLYYTYAVKYIKCSTSSLTCGTTDTTNYAAGCNSVVTVEPLTVIDVSYK